MDGQLKSPSKYFTSNYFCQIKYESLLHFSLSGLAPVANISNVSTLIINESVCVK